MPRWLPAWAQAARRVMAPAAFLALAAPAPAGAEDVGELIYADGQAQLIRNVKPVELAPSLPIMEGDTMRAPIESRMKLVLDDDTVIMLWDDSELRLVDIRIDFVNARRELEFELVTGNARILVPSFMGAGSEVRIQTPSARLAMDEGGDLVLRHSPAANHTEIIQLDGSATAHNLFADYAGAATLEPQQTTVVSQDGAPSEPVFMERQAFDELVAQLRWVLPNPVPNWDAFFRERLEELGVEAFGRVRRQAARPLLPVRGATEGLMDQGIPDRPGTVVPEPKSTLEVEWVTQPRTGEETE